MYILLGARGLPLRPAPFRTTPTFEVVEVALAVVEFEGPITRPKNPDMTPGTADEYEEEEEALLSMDRSEFWEAEFLTTGFDVVEDVDGCGCGCGAVVAVVDFWVCWMSSES
jgi:hypothetical protein